MCHNADENYTWPGQITISQPLFSRAPWRNSRPRRFPILIRTKTNLFAFPAARVMAPRIAKKKEWSYRVIFDEEGTPKMHD